MLTAEDRTRILKMVQEGRLTVDEASRLIQSGDSSPVAPRPPQPQPVTPPSAPRERSSLSGKWLRVNVSNASTGEQKVYVRIPLSLVRSGLHMGAKYSPELNNLDMQDIEEWLASGETGKIVEVMDHEDGEHVEIYIE